VPRRSRRSPPAAHAQGRLQFGMEQSADVLKAWLR
jgi:hypothetical protein